MTDLVNWEVEKILPKRRKKSKSKPRAKPKARQKAKPKAKLKTVDRIIGIDGEGISRFPHQYNYMAACDENGESWDISSERITTKQALDFILSLPKATIVAFSFLYDITKILQELSNKHIHKLLHPERRRRFKKGKILYRPIHWNEYRLNYMNGRFSVAKYENEKLSKPKVIWDIWRFFQSRFTKALTDWGIASEEQLQFMIDMKMKRGSFDREDPEDIKKYCRDHECRRLAQLFRALLNAHSDTGLKLKTYFGAGSTSSALLNKMGIKDQVSKGPPEAKYAIASAFSAGWFENAVIGPIDGPLYDSDISSAYPYQATLLPCLLCGKWSHILNPSDSDIHGATLACVKWELPYVEPVGLWGPFPVRTEGGSIIHPWSAPGGWVWKKEFLAGKKLAPYVLAKEAWLYHTSCQHKPFQELPQYYLERIRVGKSTGPGKVFKLGLNGVYGKLAQKVGFNPPFQCFIWAGVITSNTRAQLLEAIITAQDKILAVATDGILSTVKLDLPKPEDTGTFGVKYPLGGWEQTEEDGRFFARPGVSFPLKEGGKGKVKGRGYGKRHIEEQKECIMKAFERGHDWCLIDDGEQFGGALSSLHLGNSKYSRSENYGEWFQTYTFMNFDPTPKRIRIEGTNRLGLIAKWEKESLPYKPALLS